MRPEQPGEEQRDRSDPDDDHPAARPRAGSTTRSRRAARPRTGTSSRAARGTSRRAVRKRLLVPRVVDEVLGQAREALVGEPELIAEPAGRARVAPPRERDRVDVQEPEGGDTRGGREDRRSEPPQVGSGQLEPATEEVGPDRDEIVAQPVEDALVRRAAAEPALRDQRVDDDEDRRSASASQSVALPSNGSRPRARTTSTSAEREQHLLPGRDDRQSRPAHARVPELGHHDVVEREPDDRARTAPRRAASRRPHRDERQPGVDDPHRVGEERRELFRAERVEHVGEASRAEQPVAARAGAGASARTASSVCGSSGNQRFGVVTNTRAATRQSSSTKRRWPSRPPATCSTTAFEKPRSNSPSANGRSRPSARTACDDAGTRPRSGRARCGRRR